MRDFNLLRPPIAGAFSIIPDLPGSNPTKTCWMKWSRPDTPARSWALTDFFPPIPKFFSRNSKSVSLKLLASFVPVKMTDPGASKAVIERIRKVGNLLAALKAPFLVIADDQSNERNAFSGRVYDKGCPTLTAEQWKHIGKIVADAEKVANEFGLDLVFHPHVATYVETPEECERFFDVTSHTNVGLCLDTGHCVYGHGDSVKEAEKYKSKLRFVHIKDCDVKVLKKPAGTNGPLKKPSNTRSSPSLARATSIFRPSSALW